MEDWCQEEVQGREGWVRKSGDLKNSILISLKEESLARFGLYLCTLR